VSFFNLVKQILHAGGGRGSAESWLVVAGLSLLLVVLVVALVRLWPLSRIWASTNHLHRLASANESGLRGDARQQLDDSLAILARARREWLALGHGEDPPGLNSLIRQIEATRDRVASDYLPSPANAPRLRRHLNLEAVLATEALGERCGELASRLREGQPPTVDQIAETRIAAQNVDRQGLVLR
jgi:hypothetical protein